MSDFSEEIHLFDEADRRFIEYPGKLRDLIGHIKRRLDQGIPLSADARAPLLSPDDPERLREVLLFFEERGIAQLRMLMITYQQRLASADIGEAIGSISSLGGLHRAWHNNLSPQYQSSIFPPPAVYLSDIHEKIYDLYQEYDGRCQRSFVSYLRGTRNPWARYAGR